METQEQVEVAAAEETAAMEALFNPAAEGGDIAGDVIADQGEPAGEESTTTTEGQQPTGETELPQYMTAEQVAELLEGVKAESKAEISRIHDRVFGKVGELQQRIDSIRATANFSPKAKERLTVEFPELAEMLFDNDPIPVQVPAQRDAAPALPAVDVDEVVNHRVAEVTKTLEVRLLKRDHPDFQEVIASPRYSEWIGTLSAEDAAEVQSSTDADICSKRLTEYKAWAADMAAKRDKDAAKKERMEAAILPNGTPRGGTGGAGTDEEEAAMLEAYGKRNRAR